MQKSETAIRLVLHILIGAIIGYAVLHPASAIIYDRAASNFIPYTASIISSFGAGHAWMAFYFCIIGALFGLLNGLYVHRTAILYEKVKKLSITDDLTGLFNRRFFIQSLNREIRRAERYGNDLALIMIDIDHFKTYNDAFGHLAGDHLLRRLADRLCQTARKTDVVSRYGGEEFVILMPDTGIAMAAHLAERIRQDVQDHPVETQGDPAQHCMTISIGCAQFDKKEGTQVDGLIKKADDCLYRAKKSGRNRICS